MLPHNQIGHQLLLELGQTGNKREGKQRQVMMEVI